MKVSPSFLRFRFLVAFIIMFPAFSLMQVTARGQSNSERSAALSKELHNLKNLKVYPADTRPAFTIHLESETSYKETDNVFFGLQLRSVKVDKKGRVYLLDFSQRKIHVFNPDGRYLQSVGGKGKGPGEFLNVSAMQVDDENLYVLDSHQNKISIFKQGTYKHLRDINISLKNSSIQPGWLSRTRKNRTFYRPNNFIVRSDGKFLIIFNDNAVATATNLPGRTDEFSLFDPAKHAYLRLDLLSFKWTGGVLASKKNGGTTIMFNVPYKRTSQFNYSNGQLVYGWTQNFLFKFYDEDGNYQRAFYYPFKNTKLTKDAVLTYYQNAGKFATQIFGNEDLPETWPAFHSVMMDDKNRLWASIFTDNPAIYKWLVLGSSGKLLATFTWPRNHKLEQVKNGYAYTLQRDKETGLQSVIKYHITIK